MSLFSSLFGKKPESEEASVPQTGPGAPAGFFPLGHVTQGHEGGPLVPAGGTAVVAPVLRQGSAHHHGEAVSVEGVVQLIRQIQNGRRPCHVTVRKSVRQKTGAPKGV